MQVQLQREQQDFEPRQRQLDRNHGIRLEELRRTAELEAQEAEHRFRRVEGAENRQFQHQENVAAGRRTFEEIMMRYRHEHQQSVAAHRFAHEAGEAAHRRNVALQEMQAQHELERDALQQEAIRRLQEDLTPGFDKHERTVMGNIKKSFPELNVEELTFEWLDVNVFKARSGPACTIPQKLEVALRLSEIDEDFKPVVGVWWTRGEEAFAVDSAVFCKLIGKRDMLFHAQGAQFAIEIRTERRSITLDWLYFLRILLFILKFLP
jgi:hypothetical protein